ncbi:MAG: tetratricopeptide repeat protein [Prevotella sp.]|nr:tetratricopeptide repeat protein [Prevotella sp.]
MRLRRLLLILLCFVSVSVFPQGKEADTEALGRALEYFQSQKYHEALLIFQRLDQSYKLNARYKAYIGLCYYYDWDYKKATEYFDTFLPKLDMLAPEERALYYYADGESHFQLGHYDQAILLFLSALTLCHDRDKGDSWFRIGFCYYFLQQPALAQGCFLVAEYYYATFRNSPDLQARRQQMAHMMRGLRPEIVLKPLPKTFSLPQPVSPTDYLKTKADTLSTVSVVKPHLPQTETQPPVGESQPQQEEPQQEESPQQKEKQQAEQQQAEKPQQEEPLQVEPLQVEKPQQTEPQQEEHKAID